MAPCVLILMWILSPVAWPTAKLLDWLLGEDHGTMYKKAGLKTLVTLHKTLGTGAGERLMEDEVTIINSVLDLKDKPVGDIMTPMQDVFTMSADTILDERMMDTILSQGYSRIPIYAPENPRNFIGMLLVKILITYDPEDCKRVRDFALATLPETAPHTSCLDIINFFQEGKSHMVLVSDFPGQDKGATGVVTLEDVIEELIGEEIIDESDVFVDVHKAIRRMAPAPKTRFNSRQWLTNDKNGDQVLMDADDAKEPDENEPLLKKENGSGSRKPSLANGQATFMMRRKSSAASENPRDGPTVPVRTRPADMKEHLKHLGPSNAASHPRSTKYTSVKIKPGVGTIPENRATTKGAEMERSQSSAAMGTTTAVDKSDVDSLRGKVASDGAAALYGTMGTPTQTARRMSEDDKRPMSAREASKVAMEHTATDAPEPKATNGQTPNDPPLEPLKLPEKMIVGEPVSEEPANDEDDHVGELGGSSFSTERSSKKRLPARSGSITETTVDAGGLKKVVLETTSSSEEGVEDNKSAGGRSPMFFGMGAKRSDQEEEDGSSGKGDGGDNGEGEGKKKRKKRGKRKKGGS